MKVYTKDMLMGSPKTQATINIVKGSKRLSKLVRMSESYFFMTVTMAAMFAIPAAIYLWRIGEL